MPELLQFWKIDHKFIKLLSKLYSIMSKPEIWLAPHKQPV